MVGTLRFAHPHMGNCESRPLMGLGLGLGRCEGGARSHAKRSAPTVFRARTGFRRFMQQLTASPHIRSDRCPYPHSACLRRGSHEDETHLQNGCLLGPRVARSSSIPHGPRRRATRPCALKCCVLCLHHCRSRDKPGREIAPQRHDQLARQRDDGDALGALAGIGGARAEPAAELAVRLMPQP